jgi:hypothetical protein
MAIQSDFFAAQQQDITERLVEQGPSASLIGFSITGIEDVMVTTLNGIATERSDDIDDGGFDVLLKEIPQVGTAGDQGPWVFQIPDRLVEALAAASPSRLDAINGEWAQTEEIAASPDLTKPVVEALASLARDARQRRHQVFLRVSL